MDRAPLPSAAEFRIVLKDVLRGVRYFLHHSAARAPLPRFEGLGGIATYIDGLPRLLQGETSPVDKATRELDRLTRAAGRPRTETFIEDFRKAGYALAKAIMVRQGLVNVLLGEHLFAAAARSACFADLAALGSADFGAAVATAVATVRPTRLVDAGDGLESTAFFLRAPNEAIAATIGLAATAWLLKRGEVDALECLDSAGDMVEALEPRLIRALAEKNPREVLARIFDEYARFLP